METQSEDCALCRPPRWARQRLREVFAPDHFNYAFLQNRDRHVHLHVIPRYAASRIVAGVEFADRDWPDHYRPGVEYIAPPTVIDAVAASLR
jgi:diadenosine tetraphosphate (Ap4A) HIT family hydrolase